MYIAIQIIIEMNFYNPNIKRLKLILYININSNINASINININSNLNARINIIRIFPIIFDSGS